MKSDVYFKEPNGNAYYEISGPASVEIYGYNSRVAYSDKRPDNEENLRLVFNFDNRAEGHIDIEREALLNALFSQFVVDS